MRAVEWRECKAEPAAAAAGAAILVLRDAKRLAGGPGSVAFAFGDVTKGGFMATDPESPHVVASLLNEQEAALVIDHLNTLGIEARSWNNNLAGAWGEGIPREIIQVVVRQAEAERARKALADFRRGQPEVNWGEIDVGDPE
jgi:hypothetical protein